MKKKKIDIVKTAEAIMQHYAHHEVPVLEEEFMKIAKAEKGEEFLVKTASVLKVDLIYE